MKHERNAEFKFLKVPNDEDILALLGSDGIREYGVFKDGEMREKMHFHNLMEIGVCRWGTGEVNIENKWYPYEAGDMIVIPQNFPHSVNSHGEKSFWEYIYLKPSDFLEKLMKDDVRKRTHYLEKAEYRPFIKSKGKAADLETEIDLIMKQARIQEYEYKSCIKGLLYALLMEIIKINHIDQSKPEIIECTNNKKVKELSLALEYIEKNYAKDLRILDIANAAFVSETALRKLFMECCAISPMQYVKKVRIDTACRMLENTAADINEISYIVGFENVSTFISNFKKIQGCTPKQWKGNILRNKE